MDQYNGVAKNKGGGFIGVLIVLIIVAVLGFFVYPRITHQKGLSAPQKLQSSYADGKLSLTWDPPTDEGAKINGYVVRVLDGESSETLIETGSTDTTYNVVDLKPGDTYFISVAAISEGTVGEYTDPVEITIPSDFSLGPPTDVTGRDQTATSVSLSWDRPDGSDKITITSYNIKYHVYDSGEPFKTATSEETSITISDLTPSTKYGVTIAAVVDKDTIGDYSEVVLIETIAAEEGPELAFSSDPSVTLSSTSAVITWGTAKSASSQVYYGATNDLGSMTSEMNTTPRVTGHSVTLSNLIPCTIYVYKVLSYDADANNIESAKGQFITTGCKGDATVVVSDKGKVTSEAGVALTAKEAGRGLSVVVPAALVSGKELAVQAIKVTREEVKSEISKPTGKSWIGGSYVLSAIEDSTTEVKSFDKPVTVSIDYQNEDMEGIDPNTLKIWHYEDGVGWRELSSCSVHVNGVGGTVTCETSSFSVFGLFGEGSSDSVESTSSGSRPTSTSSNSNNTVVVETSNENNEVVMENTVEETVAPVNPNNAPENENMTFTKNLWYQIKDMEVMMLQKFLNKNGFKVSEDGAGSSGQETDYFGPKTKDALIRFQEAYKEKILVPLGLNMGTGFFGPQTRAFINSL